MSKANTHPPAHSLRTRRLPSHITSKVADAHLSVHFREFSSATGAIKLKLDTNWTRSFPDVPGAYAVYCGTELIYVGETGRLRGRMRDLADTRNHTLRRQLGKAQFATTTGFAEASTKKKFPPNIETLLTEYMRGTLRVKAREVALGRKEVEEELIHRLSPKHNIKKRRAKSAKGERH